MHARKVFIVGAGGMVGATIAQALAIKEIVHDIRLLDVQESLVQGQAMDISDATAYTDGVRVQVGSYDEIAEDDIVVIAAGAPQKPGQSRRDLLAANGAILESVVKQVMANAVPVYLLVVANPVDVLTYRAWQLSGLPKNRVLGTGTSLDTARLHVAISDWLGVSQRDVEGFVVGEHGDSSFVAWSTVRVAGVPIVEHPAYNAAVCARIESEVQGAAYKIIEAKRATFYGVGHTAAKIVEALLGEKPVLFPVCSVTSGQLGLHDVAIGLPSFVGRQGVEIQGDATFAAVEKAALHASAAVLRSVATP